MMALLPLALLALSAAAGAAARPAAAGKQEAGWWVGAHSGWATAYSKPLDMDATGQNMCEFNESRELNYRHRVYYAAMNQADWNAIGGKESICRRCIRARGVPGQVAPGHEIVDVVVKIVDQCPSWACNKGSVDFSTTALQAITGYGWDKKQIKWEYTDCPVLDSSDNTRGEYLKAKAEAADKGVDAPTQRSKPAASPKAEPNPSPKASPAPEAEASPAPAAEVADDTSLDTWLG
jgi:hypothetical protein